MGKTVTIPLERFQELLDCERFEDCLQGAGVDNWEGYDYAREMYKETTEEEALAEAAQYEPKFEDDKDF